MRGFFLMILMGMVMLSVLATDLYLPSLPFLASYFETTQNYAQLSLSLYLAVFALGMLLMGPLSDRYGRRKVFLWTIAIDLCGGLLCLFSGSIAFFLAGRALQGFGGSGGTVLSRIIARESFEGAECIKVLAYLFTAISCAIAVSPALGGILQKTFGWKASFIVLISYSLLLLSCSLAGLKETLMEEYRKPLHLKAAFENYILILKNVHFRYFGGLLTLAWTGFFAFVTGSSFVYIEVLQQSPQYFGVLFALIMCGMVFGTLIAAPLFKRLGQRLTIFCAVVLCSASGIALIFSPQSVLCISLFMALYQIGCGILLPICQMGATQTTGALMSSSFSLLYFAKMLGASLAGILVGLFSMGAVIGFFALLVLLTFAASLYSFRNTGAMPWKIGKF